MIKDLIDNKSNNYRNELLNLKRFGNFYRKPITHGYIYLIYNNNDDNIYIGSSQNNIQLRFKQHINKSKNSTTLLGKHMNKIGTNNFSIKLIEKVYVKNRDELIKKEFEYINNLKPQLNKVLTCYL
jgi:group I intron endonuclease